MFWYKFLANYGPGHQSKSIEYRFFEYSLDDEELRCELEYWARDRFPHTSQIYAKADQVDCLPRDIHKREIQKYKSSIQHAKKMLDILEKTPVEPVD